MVLSYRHAFHAGNAGDVVKHSVLALILTALATKKPKPLLFLDTHAAAGRYTLTSSSSSYHPTLPHSEYHTGIAKLWTHRRVPVALTPYLYAVRAINGFTPTAHAPAPQSHLPPASPTPSPSADLLSSFSLPSTAPSYPSSAYSLSSLVHYPGSPSLFLHLRRPQDRMLAYELHSTERVNLANFLSSQSHSTLSYPFYPSTPTESRVTPRPCKVMEGSGFSSFALLPQPERRGLVFVDPPYEVAAEYDEVVEFIQRAVHRWATATYLVWYPLIRGKEELADRMRDALQRSSTHTDTHTRADTPLLPLTSLHPPSLSQPSYRPPVVAGLPKMMDVRFSMYSFLKDDLTPLSPVGSPPSTSSERRGREEKRLSLYGCGLIIVNPPHLLDSLLQSSLLPFLSTALTSTRAPADYAVHWLNS